MAQKKIMPAKRHIEVDQISEAQQPQNMRRMDAPAHYSSMAQVGIAGNDVNITFFRAHPLVTNEGAVAPFATFEPVTIINVSISTLKDMSIVISKAIAQWEDKFGTVETDFTRRTDAENEMKSNQ